MTRIALALAAVAALVLLTRRRPVEAAEPDDRDWLAEGAPVGPADWYLVGTSGPELLVIGDHGYVIPAYRN